MPCMLPAMLIRRIVTALLAGALAVAAGAAGAQESIRLPDLGGSAQAVLTPFQADRYGAQMLHRLRSMGMVLDDPLVDAYINAVGHRLAAHSDDPTHKFTFFVVKTSDVNAFAAPGGYIGVNAGLIELTQDESELAAVMAHEIGHITQHHLERAFEAAKKDAPLTALVILGAIAAEAAGGGHGGYAPYGYNGHTDSGGDAAMGVLAAGMGLMQQRSLNFSRKDEIEADRMGIRTLAAAGYDPEAMADFFQRMQDTLGNGDHVPELLLTHPVTLERIAAARARARGLEKRAANAKVPPMSQQQWQEVTAPIAYLTNPAELTTKPTNGDAAAGLDLYKLMRSRVRALSMSASAAVEYYSKHFANKQFDTIAHHYGYALALLRDNQPGKALAQIQPLAARHPSSLPLQLALADALQQNGKTTQALAAYASLNSASPGNRAIVLAWSKALINDKTPANGRKAANLLRPLLDNTAGPQLFKIYARASDAAGDHFNAAEAWANVSYLEGRPFDAMQQLQRLLKDPKLNYYQRARVQADINQLRPLLLELRKQHVQTPDRPY